MESRRFQIGLVGLLIGAESPEKILIAVFPNRGRMSVVWCTIDHPKAVDVAIFVVVKLLGGVIAINLLVIGDGLFYQLARGVIRSVGSCGKVICFLTRFAPRKNRSNLKVKVELPQGRFAVITTHR